MNNKTRTLHCLKCSGDLIIESNQSLGKCGDCDTLHPLPKVIFNNIALNHHDETLIEKLNRASEYARNYQFHKAFNIYDKITKSYPNDFYAYWGKTLAQYGVIYRLNEALENEIICLRTNLERIFDNENYQKTCELADMHTLTIIKKEALQIDRFNQTSLMSLIKIKPMDVFILVDDTTKDIELANELKEQLTLVGKEVYLPVDLFNMNQFANLEAKIYPAIEMAPIMIVISSSKEHFESSLFKNIWIRYLQKQKSSQYHLGTYLLTNNIPFKENSDIIQYSKDKIEDLINDCINKLDQLDLTIPKAGADEEAFRVLLNENKFEDVLLQTRQLIALDNTNNVLWWLALLAKNSWRNEDELIKWSGNLADDFYFQKAYILACLPKKKYYYQLMEQCLANLEALEQEKISKLNNSYYENVLVSQSNLYKKYRIKGIKRFLVIIVFNIFAFLTLSLGNILSILFVISGFGLTYFFYINLMVNVFRFGKKPKKINLDIAQIKQSFPSDEVAMYLPSPLFKRLKQLTIIFGIIGIFLSSGFLVKEIVTRINYSNLSYYYFFDEAIITGGKGEYIFIPSKIDKRKVTTVKKYAFYQTKIKKVEIEAGVKRLGNGAFANCELLEMIILPNTINKVGEAAPFEGCNENLKISYSRSIPLSSLLGKNYELKITGLNIIED